MANDFIHGNLSWIPRPSLGGLETSMLEDLVSQIWKGPIQGLEFMIWGAEDEKLEAWRS